MRTAIYVTLDHKLSTDAKPKYDHCPSGENSWCSWQRAKATGTSDKYTHKSPLHEEVYKTITPIYEKLTSDDLLTHCIGGFTQNSNEFQCDSMVDGLEWHPVAKIYLTQLYILLQVLKMMASQLPWESCRT